MSNKVLLLVLCDFPWLAFPYFLWWVECTHALEMLAVLATVPVMNRENITYIYIRELSWGQIKTKSPLVSLAWFIQLSANVQACVSVGVSYWTALVAGNGSYILWPCGHDLRGTTWTTLDGTYRFSICVKGCLRNDCYGLSLWQFESTLEADPGQVLIVHFLLMRKLLQIVHYNFWAQEKGFV